MKAAWYLMSGLWLGAALDYFIAGRQAHPWFVGGLCLIVAWEDYQNGRES